MSRQPPCEAEGSVKNWQKVISQPHIGGPGGEPTRFAGGDKSAEGPAEMGTKPSCFSSPSPGFYNLDSHQGLACALAPEGDI